MSKKRKRRLALAVCAAAGAAMLFIWSFTSLGARLCFTARILAALPDAGKEAEDGLSEDGSQLMFRTSRRWRFGGAGPHGEIRGSDRLSNDHLGIPRVLDR